MFKSFFVFLFLIIIFVAEAATQAPLRSKNVLVSVAPYKFFVEKIAGDTVKVTLIVPAGASAHTYEPTPKQMLSASQADIWFLIGESFETKALASLQSHNSSLVAIDMRQGIDLIYATDQYGGKCHSCCHGTTGVDLHFWLSPRLVKLQAETIADALIRYYPENKERYTASLHKFLDELDELDDKITDIMRPVQNRTVMVSHPAYAYFCRDYNLDQLSIEFEGKDPTPQQLTKVIQKARELHIKTIFVQKQYSSKGAKLIAAQLGAKLVELDPYAENYYKAMLSIAEHFSGKNP